MGGLGGDNMSIIIVCFLHGKPWQDLVDRCKKIHSEKKASSKLCEPAFSAFDRFNEGPFADMSALKTSEDFSNSNESSSPSHTSSPSSSSPISTDEKFEPPVESTSQVIINTDKDTLKSEIDVKTEEANKEVLMKDQTDTIGDSKTANEDIIETSTATESSDKAIVSNGD